MKIERIRIEAPSLTIQPASFEAIRASGVAYDIVLEDGEDAALAIKRVRAIQQRELQEEVARLTAAHAAAKAATQPRPATTATPPPSAEPPKRPLTPDGKPFPLSGEVPAGQRRCGHPAHPAREPLPISSREWDASHAGYGKPLCDAHMAEARAARPRA